MNCSHSRPATNVARGAPLKIGLSPTSRFALPARTAVIIHAEAQKWLVAGGQKPTYGGFISHDARACNEQRLTIA